jgi:hypothetical protein
MGISSPAAILKSGTRGDKFFRAGCLFPFYSPKIFFLEAKVATKIEKMAKIKLFICNELRIFGSKGTGCQVPLWLTVLRWEYNS